jgi:hypothetical protein
LSIERNSHVKRVEYVDCFKQLCDRLVSSLAPGAGDALGIALALGYGRHQRLASRGGGGV